MQTFDNSHSEADDETIFSSHSSISRQYTDYVSSATKYIYITLICTLIYCSHTKHRQKIFFLEVIYMYKHTQFVIVICALLALYKTMVHS